MSASNTVFIAQDDSGLAIRTRRSKGKSKGGCAACKQKRVKCDETRPICSRCKANNRSCLYDAKPLPKWKDKVGILVLSKTSKASSPPKVDVRGLTSPPFQSVRPGSTPFNIFEDFRLPKEQLSTMPSSDLYTFRSEDSTLLDHFMSRTSSGLVGSQEIWLEQALRLAFQNNFLMHALLALTARHIKYLQDSANENISYSLSSLELHHHHQTLSTYQTAFRDNTVRINQNAVLATSLLLCFYSCSLLDFNPSATVPVTDSCLTFYPGIRSIVSDAPQIAHNGLFRSIVTPPLFLKHLHPSIGPGARLLNLLSTLQPTPSNVANKEIYIERIESLTLYMSTCSMQTLEAGALRELIICFLRWQSFCPQPFIALIREFDEVALIILAHWYAAGGFAHSRAGNPFWWWKLKAVYMVRTISSYLAPQWSAWMKWPNSMIERYGKGETLKLTEDEASKPWSSAVDPVEASSFPDLYNWERLKSYSERPGPPE